MHPACYQVTSRCKMGVLTQISSPKIRRYRSGRGAANFGAAYLSYYIYCYKPNSATFCHMTRITRKQTLRSLPRPSFFWYDTFFSEFDSADIIDYILEKSVSCQKKGGRGHARLSFFWYDNDKDLNVCFLKECVADYLI